MPRGFLAHRSKQELRFTAHLRQLLFGHVDDTSLEEAVQQGERAHNADCGLHLDATRLYVEWDGERCHATQERIEADVRKTRLLLSDESAVVVRLRSKCPPIPQLDLDKRVFVVLTKSNPVEALGDMARQGVASLLPEPYAARMQGAAGFYAGERTWRVAEQALQDLLRRKQVEFGQRVRELADVTGGGVAGKLSRFYEALVSGALLAGAHRLAAAPYRISGGRLVSFMCDGVAAALSPERREGFFECLDCLAAAPYHISGGRLVSFMCGGVAAALSPERREGFFECLDCLAAAPYHISGGRLVSFMCNGVAAALSPERREGFFECLDCLAAAPYRISGSDLVTFMCDGVAAALSPERREGFFECLDCLAAAPYHISGGRLVSFMCGGVAAALSPERREGFFECLDCLAAAPYSISGSDLVTFMCDGVAAALSPERREGFFECLDCLAAAPYRISGSDLVTFMCGGVAAALSPERREGFFECLDRLAVAPYHISGGRLVSFMCNSVAAALSPERRDGFFAELSVLMGASATRLPTHKEVRALCRRVMLQHPAIIVKLVKRDGEWRVLA